MVKCEYCHLEMRKHETFGCTCPYVKIDGKYYWRNVMQCDFNRRCHDCGIRNHEGYIHHFGCDMERCPKCSDQFAFCGCPDKIILKLLPCGVSPIHPQSSLSHITIVKQGVRSRKVDRFTMSEEFIS